jgi:hypothetical protein
MKKDKRQSNSVKALQSLLDELAEDVSAWQEMGQYETFLEGLARLYDVENPEAVYEQWVLLPEHTTELLHQMLNEAEALHKRERFNARQLYVAVSHAMASAHPGTHPESAVHAPVIKAVLEALDYQFEIRRGGELVSVKKSLQWV